MSRRVHCGIYVVVVAATAAIWIYSPAAGQALNREIVARARVFPEIGAGVSALKRDSAGRYYILGVPATVIAIYAPDGKRIGQIPNANSGGAKIVYAEDIDLDAAGRLFVADRGANAVKIFSADSSLAASVPVMAPTSMAVLPGDEIAVAAMRSDRFVDVLDERGKLLRSFGDPADMGDAQESKRLLSHGRITGDAAGHIYFAFTYLPDPAIKKYDRYGFAAYEISLTAEEFLPSGANRPREILRLDRHTEVPTTKPVISAIGVDPVTQEVWAAIGGVLLHFDKDGARLPSYRTVTKDGARVDPKAILIEPDRILLAADLIGVFEFARPDKQPTVIPER
ncbi:MAG: hypothetical protein WBP79_04935 [Candidatus Acidiferrales bacterium]